MAEQQELTAALGIDVYFCDPRSSWQRGGNENTNRLLRQQLGKNADLSAFTLRELDDIAGGLNTRPRRVLGWQTAHELLQPQFTAAWRAQGDLEPDGYQLDSRAVRQASRLAR